MESPPIASVVGFGWGNEEDDVPIYTGGWFAAPGIGIGIGRREAGVTCWEADA